MILQQAMVYDVHIFHHSLLEKNAADVFSEMVVSKKRRHLGDMLNYEGSIYWKKHKLCIIH